MQLTIISFWPISPYKIYSLTPPWPLVISLKFPWQLSKSTGFPDKWAPCAYFLIGKIITLSRLQNPRPFHSFRPHTSTFQKSLLPHCLDDSSQHPLGLSLSNNLWMQRNSDTILADKHRLLWLSNHWLRVVYILKVKYTWICIARLCKRL